MDVTGRRRKNSGGAAGAWGVAIIIMAMFGSCIDDDTTDPAKSVPKARVSAQVFTARVVEVSWKVTVEVEGNKPYFYLANAGGMAHVPVQHLLSAARRKGPFRSRFCHEYGTTCLPLMGPPD
ncbi:hypothetical protein IU483_24775 [Streptomyces gardneri]|nr:hypothetical protein [Streptomyces gardneri]